MSRPLPRGSVDVAALQGFRPNAEPQTKAVETPYLFGLHPLALIVPAVLALVLMVVDPLAIILGGSQ